MKIKVSSPKLHNAPLTFHFNLIEGYMFLLVTDLASYKT